MEFIWGDLPNQKNQRLEFNLDIKENCDTLVVCAVDFYQVYLDGKFNCYGPARTASGYVRPRTINVGGVKNIKIKVVSYGIANYMCDLQKPFFGAELKKDQKIIYTVSDFNCYIDNSIVTDSPRFSAQRGFVEIFDLTKKTFTPVKTFSVSEPKIIDEIEDFGDYICVEPRKKDEGVFYGFKNIRDIVTSYDSYQSCFSVRNDLIEKDWCGYCYKEYEYERIHTGFISIKGNVTKPTDVLIFFEEYCEDGKWTLRRSGCNEFILLKLPQGEFEILTFEPYSCKHLKIVYKTEGSANFCPAIISLENKNAKVEMTLNNPKAKVVIDAAKHTFRQNAIDIFMDCPSRERAGWLCDSYFTGKAEKFFCGNNVIEKAFIENLLVAETPEIDGGMIPKCFPAEHRRNLYIPNWAMWFIVEILDYYDRTGDVETVNKAKDKVYGVVDFFKSYENEIGLLENLPSWVFIEWSVCNTPEYTRGVNYPSNMLYAYVLECIYRLYEDTAAKEKAQKLKNKIVETSFNGEFFCDNSIRENGSLMRREDHISETCQYYALFTGLCPSEEFKNKMITEFGPKRKNKYPDIGKSNMFIGNYLRLFWLCSEGEYQRVLDECLDYFYEMAKKTGTLWEHNRPTASCNHGFASVAAVIISECLEKINRS